MACSAGHKKKLFDDLLVTLKTGKWNYCILLVVSLWIMQMPFNVFSGAFSTPAVPHTCISDWPTPRPLLQAPKSSQDTATKQPAVTTVPSDLENVSHVGQRIYFGYSNETFLFDNESLECAPPGGSPDSCTAWAFDSSTYGQTITLEFNLVCNKQVFRPLYTSVYFFGAVVGSYISGGLSDRFGRRRVFLLSAVLFAVAANILPWLNDLTTVLVLRGCLGFLHPCTVQACFSLVMEVFEERRRAMAGIIVFVLWPLAMVVMAGVCYLVKDWRWQSFYLALPSLLTLPLIWTVDESPRWLIVRGRHDEAHETLKKAAKWNKTTLPPVDELWMLMRRIRDQSADNSRRAPNTIGGKFVLWRILANVALLLRTQRIRRITLVTYSVFLVTSLSYFGLSLSGDLFSSEPFLYLAISGVVELPGCTLTVPLVERLGRKRTNIWLHLISGAALITLTSLPDRFESAVMGLALVGKLTISAAYQVILLHAGELFPTEVRALGMGIGSMLARIGSVLASFLVGILPKSSAAPSIIFSCCSFVAVAAMLMLPETRAAALYDTVAALESARQPGEQDEEDKEDEKEAVRSEGLKSEDDDPNVTTTSTTTTATTITTFTDTTSFIPSITVISPSTASSSSPFSSLTNITSIKY